MRCRRGFTLLEVMIVALIVGIIAAIALPRFQQTSRNARNAEPAMNLRQLCTLSQTYYELNGAYPASETAMPNWLPPNSTNFVYTYTPSGTGGTATATAQNSGVDTQVRACNTI